MWSQRTSWLPKSQANLRDQSSIKSQGRGRDAYTYVMSSPQPEAVHSSVCLSFVSDRCSQLLIRFLPQWFLLEKSQYIARCYQPTYNKPCLTLCPKVQHVLVQELDPMAPSLELKLLLDGLACNQQTLNFQCQLFLR